MSPTWRDAPSLAPPRPGTLGLLRAALRGTLLAFLLVAGLLALVMLRALRPRLAPWVTVTVCRLALPLLGLRVRRRGAPLRGPGAILANHSSWLDILALNAAGPVVFVAKAEVAGWPLIGLLARATGTLFVRREARAEAAAQVAALRARLRRGETLALFPEGTTTDNLRVLPFRPPLLAALRPDDHVQPVTIAWAAPPGEDPRFLAWWGDAPLGPHALAVLAARGGGVTVTHHPPVRVGALGRKDLAALAEAAVRAAL